MERETVTQEAVRWLDALKRDDADWDGFTAWLEAGPDHRTAYDEAALIDQRIDAQRDRLAVILPADEPARPARRWWAWGGGVGAAAAAAIAGLAILPVGPAETDQVYRTAPGQNHLIALADGSRINLASGSSLTVKPGEQQLALDGTASFAVPHRPGRTLTVQAAGMTIQDIGTRFEVVTGDKVARVAVAEGQVSVAAPELAGPVRIVQGKRLTVDRAAGVAELKSSAEFAAWQRGRLVYEDAPLPLVAAEVGRYAGRRVLLAPALSSRRFSGVLTIGDGSAMVEDLARLMDVDARADGKAYRLAAHSSR